MRAITFLFVIVVAVLFAPLAFFALKPGAEMVGIGQVTKLPELPKAEPERQALSLNYHAPLALLILDRSGSMKGNDPEFRQSLAAQVFSYFYAHLIAEDVTDVERQNVHFGVVLYSAITEGHGVREVENISLPGGATNSASCVLWNELGATAKWLPLMGGATDFHNEIAQRLRLVDAKFDRLMGRKGNDLRTGETPYVAAVVAAQKLIDEYRGHFGPDAPVFAVFMTDLGFKNEPALLQQSRPGLRVAAVQIKNAGEADRMVPGFLEALQMEQRDVTTECSKDGFDLAPFQKRLVPILIKGGGQPPTLETDDGQPVELLVREGMHYGIFDPREPRYARSQRIRLAGGAAREVVTFRRPHWELSLDPPVFDLLAPQEVPTMTLRYTGPQEWVDKASREITLGCVSGEKLPPVTLQYDAKMQAFTGRLPTASDFLPCRADAFKAVWLAGPGQQLAFGFRVSRNVRARFQRKSDKAISREVALEMYPPARL